MSQESLYQRLGSYDGIAAFASELLRRARADSQLGRFWEHRGDDGIARELQLLVNYLCANTGGPMVYTGRNMKISHAGMRISESDWGLLMEHASDTMQTLKVPQDERDEVGAFVLSLKEDIVEA